MPRVYPAIEDRLRNYVRIDENGCHVWIRHCHSEGYGVVGYKGRPEFAHRVSYMVRVGPIPRGLFVCHHCDNRPCINPDHLFLGTAVDNALDMVSKGRHSPRYGADHARVKLTDAQVQEIRSLPSVGKWGAISVEAVAAQYGVSDSHVYKIRARGRRAWEFGVVKRGQPASDAPHNGAEGLKSLSVTHVTEHEAENVQEVGPVTQGVECVLTG